MSDRSVTTYSMWSLFRNCRKAAQYRYVLDLVPIERDRNLAFGSLIHEALEIWHRTRDLGATLDLVDRACANRAGDEEQRRTWHLEGFLEDTEKLYEEADSEGQEWREFVTAWWAIHGDTWVATADLLRLAGERDLLGGVVGDKSERSRLIRLGRALSAARDRHFGAYRVAAGRNSNSKAAQYRLLAAETEGGAAAPTAPASGATSGFGDGLDDLLVPMEGAS